ncbi:hypothetical protein AV654_19335 [Paenibacillus elgii]|uniref:Uncharacterized protein n=1 Tax=Paenibacillus elgii TaxID=189691 RepID=A0A163XMK6_9BACL|nr:hypothetical protein [Paenibacillus elgii]KZE78130.1 hypothetical protein AV654_19335 [Paenibacillus elgii]
MKKWFFGLLALNVFLYSLPQEVVLSSGMQWIGGLLLISIFGVIAFHIFVGHRQTEQQNVCWHEKTLGGIYLHGALVFRGQRRSKAKSQSRRTVLAQLRG